MQNTKHSSTSLEHKLKKDDIMYFLHIEKAGGTTLMNILDSYFDYESICQEQFWNTLIRNNPDLTKYRLFRGHFGYGIHRILPKEPIYLTLLRNPVNRIISDYNFKRRVSDALLEKKYPDSSLLEILKDPKRKAVLRNNLETKSIAFDPDVSNINKNWDKKTMEDFVGLQLIFSNMTDKISEEELLENAKQNLSQFKFLGILEKFEESLLLLYYTFGWRPITKNWALNISPKKFDNANLSNDTIDTIKQHNKLDLELYNFGKKLFEERFSQMVKNLKEKFYEKSFADLTYNEMIYKMLEKNYELRFKESKIPQVQSIDYNFREKLSGTGWYWREILEENGNAFRWTGPETSSTIDFPLAKEEDLVIQLRVLRYLSQDVIDSIKIKVNEHPIEIKILDSKTGSKVFEGFIPKSALSNKNDFVRISFEINRTINPHEINSLDPTDRLLGIAIDRIKIMPAKEYDKTKDQISIEGSSFFSKKNFQWKARIAAIRVGEKFKSSQKQ